ncbi:helix-hairpin-helix domain-containing protein [Streptomyces sp. 4N509B]|uniref:helix-hairpin-helix domain-containing protein n=1 Tax=Streptomyces sp. 4N509B TaxID=3457413 RepID=UPI003FD4F614
MERAVTSSSLPSPQPSASTPPSSPSSSPRPQSTTSGADRPRSVAEELRAAVRAVESGERAAASFFPEAAKPARSRAVVSRGSPAAVSAASVDPVTVAAVAKLLAEGGVPEALASAAVATLGEAAEEALRADPWQLLAVAGVGPARADDFARALLGAEGSPGDERRSRALVVWLLERAALAGHTAVAAGTVAAELAAHGVPEPEAAVRAAVERGAVLAFEDTGPEAEDDAGAEAEAAGDPATAETAAEGTLLGLDRYALAEESLADGLTRLLGTFGSSLDEASLDERGEAEEAAGSGGGPGARWEAAARAAPTPAAAALIRGAAGSGLLVHTGGEAARAEVAALVGAARALGLRAYGAAHTTDGRRRLAALLPDAAEARTGAASGGGGSEDTREEAAGGVVVTVEGLLTGREGPGRDADGLLAVDLLAVVDAPQLGTEHAASLVEALPDGARLVLSGDPLLLGAAGPGQVVADVLASGVCPHLASDATEPGVVGRLVADVGVGRLRPVEAPGREVVIVPVRDAAEAVHRTVQLVAESIPRAFGETGAGIQVITVGHGGAAGTRALNAALKERLNPGPGRFGGFDPGDRVVHSPVPGRADAATVARADAEGLWLDGEEGPFVVARERVAETVRHGWAVTAHQAAGSRWPAAVVVLPGDAAAALTRSWVYTAFGRGQRHLSVVQGVGSVLPDVVAGPAASPRTTRLRTLLRG